MQFRYAMIPPPTHLAGSINTFYVIETEAGRIDEVFPAYSAQLVVFIRGTLTMAFPDGETTKSSTITVKAPQLRSAPCVLEGPAKLVGASLTALGWQALSNLPADEVHDQMVPAETVLTPDQCAMLAAEAAECRAGRLGFDDMCARLGLVIAAAPFTQRPDHVAVIDAMTRWLGSGFDPPISNLHDAVAVSPRQLQRLSRRYFGVPPAQVLKRYRAIRAAMLLANPALPENLRAEMLTTYFDQAHLIRDIRRYTGRTPRQLRAETISTGLLDPAGHGDAAALLRPADG